MNRIASLIVLLLLVNSLCIGQGTSKPKTRIVTAGSVLTEIVCALGHTADIVATDRTSMYPQQMVSLPSIGYRTGIGAEGILAQDPTLVLVEKEYVRAELSAQLKGSGITFHEFEAPLSFDATRKLIQQVAVVLHEEAAGKTLVARLEKEMQEVNNLLKKAPARPRVLFIYARGEGTQMIAGKETFSENLIRLAGGTPAVDITGFKPLNTEEMIAANPDYLLFGDSGLESLGGVNGVMKIQGVDQTTAGKKKNIIAMDMVMMSNFGPRLPQAVKELLIKIHPEAAL